MHYVPVLSLWLPIVVSAVFVFIVSSVVHSVLKYHASDYGKLPSEADVMNDLGKYSVPPGDYVMPHAANNEERKSPEFQDRVRKGPVAFITVLPNGMPGMTASLVQWFGYCLLVGVFAAYVAGRALEPGAHYLSVFRFAGTTAFLGYAVALVQDSIWFYRPWSTTFKNLFDGLVYALLTAGTFGWLWPGM